MGGRLPPRIALPTMPTWKSTIAKLWSYSQKVAERRLLFTLFACAILAYGGAFAWHMFTRFDLVNLVGAVNYDDAFYYFQIAHNLAQGKFSTFDGGITQTNGYHPVWMLLITPFYWLFDKETALLGIKAFEITLVAAGVALIATAARLARLAWPLLFAALPMLYHYPNELLWGMEAAAAMFALALLILGVCLYIRAPQRWKWHIAAIAFALPWVRIEYIAISLAVTAALCAIEWSRMEQRSLRLSELANIRHAYIPMIGAIAGMLVYFAYNRLIFGGILPVSAAVRRAWSQAQIAQEGGYDFIQNFWDTLSRSRVSVFDYELLIAFEICAYLLLVWRLALRSNERRDWLLVAFLVGIFGLAAGHIAKFAQIVLITPYIGGKAWYFVPAYLMTALIIPVRLYIAIYLMRRFLAPRRRAAANVLSVAVAIIGAAVLLRSADFSAPFRWVDSVSGSSQIGGGVATYMGVQVMNRALPEGSVIGSWDAGVVGYFSRFPVVNLDGLVNSYDYFHARVQPTQRIQMMGDIDLYQRYGITHFANFRRNDQITNNVIFEGAPFDTAHHSEHRFRLWAYGATPETYVETDYSQQVWDSLLPHFDYSSDGVGVLLAGRTAQAFAKDCRPDDPLIWTWSDQKHERILIEPNLYQTRANMCVASRMLPHAAEQPAQVKIAPLKSYFANLTASRAPIIRSDFNVYLSDGSLIYTKSQCGKADVENRFFANIYPIAAAALPVHIRQRGYETIDFNFTDYGAIADDGKCWAAVYLPNYSIAEIHAGQYVVTGDEYIHIWEATYKIGASAPRAAQETYLGNQTDREPIIRSDFDVYLIDESLIYTKSQCSQANVGARFFVNRSPIDADRLSDDRKIYGYDALEFDFSDYGVITADAQCWAEISLPNYPIAEIHTGQYEEVSDGYDYLWEAVYKADLSALRPAEDANLPNLTDREPIIRSNFDVYIIDDSLIYTKRQCSQTDIEGRFSAVIFPLDANDLPAIYRQRGYDRIDFKFGDYGAIADDGKCWAEIALPDYPIAELRAEQYAAGIGVAWEGSAYPFGMAINPDFSKLTDRSPIIRSDFDVYLIDGSLIYTKQQCSQADIEGRFSANIFPVDPNDLPAVYWHSGRHRIEFEFMRYGAITDDGQCWAEVTLPNYPIAEILTGRYVAENYVWSGARRIGPKADFALLTDRKPIIRSDFDVYLIDGKLIYTKQQCGEEDTAARFYISIDPVNADDLPDDRIQHGYDAIEFNFGDYDLITDDARCWAEISLPSYPIAELRTGQYIAENYLWGGAHHPE